MSIAAEKSNPVSYPNRAIRMVVPFSAGGGTDVTARIVSQKLSENLNVPVVVDNRPGAGSMIGTEHVARAAPDGYTLITAASEHAINPEPLALWEAIRQGATGRRRVFDGLIDEFSPGKYDPPHAALRIIYKDMTVAAELARELGVTMRFNNLVLADVIEALNRGWADRDWRSVMLLRRSAWESISPSTQRPSKRSCVAIRRRRPTPNMARAHKEHARTSPVE